MATRRKRTAVDHTKALSKDKENTDPALDVHDAAQVVFPRLSRGIATPGDEGATAVAAEELSRFFGAAAKVLAARRVFTGEVREPLSRVVRLAVQAVNTSLERDAVGVLLQRIDVAADGMRGKVEGCETPDAAADTLTRWLFSSPSWRPLVPRLTAARGALAKAIDARAGVGQNKRGARRVAADEAVAAFLRAAGFAGVGADRIANLRSESRKRSRVNE